MGYVLLSPDPSFNRPGGNITGASFLTAAVAGKRLELLRELIPTAAVIDYLVNPDNALGQPEIADAEAAARTHGLKLNVVNVVNERREYDFDQAFATIVQHRPDALFVGGDPVFLIRRRELVPGGLMSYGTSIPEHARRLLITSVIAQKSGREFGGRFCNAICSDVP
jgi:putative ABC transport system substrate-binding protein